MSDGPTRLLRRVTPWFEAAVRTNALGERLLWEITFSIQPNTNNQPVPVILFYLEMPAATLGNVFVDVSFIPVIGLQEPRVERDVRAAIERLLQQRSAELSTLNGKGQRP